MSTALPPLPYAEWKETKTTLHLFAQIVGKVRLALSPRLNHWWHVPYYVSARGLATGAIPCDGGLFDIEFDLIDHRLMARRSDGRVESLALVDRTVQSFYRDLMARLAQLGVEARILPRPFDPGRAGSDIPFARDDRHGVYDTEAVDRFRAVLTAIDPIFRRFRGRFQGKCSPVHFFWHSFDLAVTRFSGRPANVPADADPVTREAYSHEVISAGFWPGDDVTLQEPAFYTYAAPEPEGLAAQPLQPAGAAWSGQNGSSLAIYRHEDFRGAAHPEQELLAFLQSSYDAAARLAAWPSGLTTGG